MHFHCIFFCFYFKPLLSYIIGIGIMSSRILLKIPFLLYDMFSYCSFFGNALFPFSPSYSKIYIYIFYFSIFLHHIFIHFIFVFYLFNIKLAYPIPCTPRWHMVFFLTIHFLLVKSPSCHPCWLTAWCADLQKHTWSIISLSKM